MILAMLAAATTPQAVPPIDGDLGKIIIYRQGAITGAAIACPVRYDGNEIVELGRNRATEWLVPPGSYILTNKTSSVEVRVDKGQTRFVRCQIKMGMLTGRADLQIVDRATYQEHAADYVKKEPAFTPKAPE